MADTKDEKKKVDAAKKQIESEVKSLVKKTKKPVETARELLEERKEIEAKKKPTPEDQKRLKEIDKKIAEMLQVCQREADGTARRVSSMLKTEAPTDKELVPVWQKGMDKWYRDILNKEPGFDIGGGTRVNGDISIKDKKAVIDFTWKF
jgi:hypothetical protein